jgi:hypothetical protein
MDKAQDDDDKASSDGDSGKDSCLHTSFMIVHLKQEMTKRTIVIANCTLSGVQSSKCWQMCRGGEEKHKQEQRAQQAELA